MRICVKGMSCTAMKLGTYASDCLYALVNCLSAPAPCSLALTFY